MTSLAVSTEPSLTDAPTAPGRARFALALAETFGFLGTWLRLVWRHWPVLWALALAGTIARELLLVTAGDCHFCERAHRVLDGLGVAAREISVGSAEAELLAGRGVPLFFLPVLTDGERVIAYGRFSETRLRRELGL